MAFPKSNKSKTKNLSAEKLPALVKQAKELLEKNPSKTVVEAFSEAGLKNPIILAGKQHVRIKRTIAWIKEQFFASATSTVGAYFGTELTSQQTITNLLNEIGTPSLFSRNSLVVIYESDKIKATVADSISEAFSRPQNATLIVIVAEEPQKSGSLASKVSGTVVEVTELEDAVLQRWLEKEAKRCGAGGIAPDAVGLLMKSFGSDTSALAHEVEKLALLTEPGGTISRALVEMISLRSPEATSFQLVQLMAQKDATRAAALAQDLVNQGMHPIQLCHFLSRSFRTLLAHSDSGDSISGELGNQWFVNQLRPAMRSFTPSQLQSSIRILKDLDFRLKDSALPDVLALGLAVQELALRSR